METERKGIQSRIPRTPLLSRQGLLDRRLHVLIPHRQTPIPKRIPPKVAQPHLLDTCHLLRQLLRRYIPTSLTRVRHRRHIQLRVRARQVLAPGL